MRSPLLFLTAILLFQACIPLNTPGATGNSVYVGNYYFTPVIDSGTADRNDDMVVTFRWADSASGVGHTIVWDSGPPPALPENVPLQFSGSYSVTLHPGNYFYHCSYHEGFGMAGVIVVVPFDTPTASKTSNGSQPASPLVIQSSPGAMQANPRKAARRSRPATS